MSSDFQTAHSSSLKRSAKTAEQVAHEWSIAAQVLTYRSQLKPLTAQDIRQVSLLLSAPGIINRR